jgi:hypothetical protein
MVYATVMVYVDFDAATEGRVRGAANLADLIDIAASAPQSPLRAGVALAPSQNSLDAPKVTLDQQKHWFCSILIAGACGHIQLEKRVFRAITVEPGLLPLLTLTRTELPKGTTPWKNRLRLIFRG